MMVNSVRRALAREEMYTVWEHHQELMDEVNRAQGEYEEALEPINQRLERVAELKQQVQDEGVSREIAAEIATLADDPDIHTRHGVVMESYSRWPSPTNRSVALEELDETQKKILIGGGAVLGLALIGKIIHVIWKWLKGSGGNGGGGKSGDESKEIRENASKTAQSINEIKQKIKQQSDVTEDLRKAYDEFLEAEADISIQAAERVEDTWNQLLETIVRGAGGSDNFTPEVIKIWNDFPNWSQAANESFSEATTLRSSLIDWIEDGVFETKMAEILAKVEKILPPEHMRNNIGKLKLLIGQANDLKQQEAPFDEDKFKAIENDMLTNSGIQFILKLETFKFSSNNGLANFDSQDKLMDIVNGLQGAIEQARSKQLKISEKAANDFNRYVKYFQEEMTLFVHSLTLYKTIKGEYDRFMNTVRNVDAKRNTIMGRLGNKLIDLGLSKDEIGRRFGGSFLQAWDRALEREKNRS